jgi:phage terminase small subunit
LRGRRSVAALTAPCVDGRPNRLKPPAHLGAAERRAFTELVASCDPSHFKPSDIALLCRYVEADVLAERAAHELRRGVVVDGKVNPWLVVQEKSVRALVALSMRLRLAPQSRLDPKTAARRGGAAPSAYDLMFHGNGETADAD